MKRKKTCLSRFKRQTDRSSIEEAIQVIAFTIMLTKACGINIGIEVLPAVVGRAHRRNKE